MNRFIWRRRFKWLIRYLVRLLAFISPRSSQLNSSQMSEILIVCFISFLSVASSPLTSPFLVLTVKLFVFYSQLQNSLKETFIPWKPHMKLLGSAISSVRGHLCLLYGLLTSIGQCHQQMKRPIAEFGLGILIQQE